MAGESGGGYICSGAMVKLAMEGESGLVKLAVPIIPMVSSYQFSDQAGMTKDEAGQADGMRRIWKLISGPEVEIFPLSSLFYPPIFIESLSPPVDAKQTFLLYFERMLIA